jgi:dolichol-phosphate mannosyltransferase
MPRAVVCLPTYDERENLAPMISALSGVLDIARDRVLVIDDASPDGTGALADELASEHAWVRVMHRRAKEGLGPAYIAGFRQALADGAELVLEMDCDFSHDPGDVPRLIAACEAEADVALGSRYAPGGGTENWGLLRQLVSRGGSLYARALLGVETRDLTGGFKCFNRRVLESIDLDAVRAQGYGFQIEVTYRALEAGFTVVELPITFAERRVGQSKMSGRIVLEAIAQVPLLRWSALRGHLEAGSRMD